jgi:hypothetical protein
LPPRFRISQAFQKEAGGVCLPDTQMSSNVLEGRSVVLHLEFSIADAVRHRGLGAVLVAAIGAWWRQQPSQPTYVPASLRADVGLDPVDDPAHWTAIDLHAFRLPPDGRRP